ncbi:hypothetical protein SCLCIDRAFT_1206925 [Scleroderma citrinum Foug A]|uniref:GPI transamidase component PIG-S n=1 Tax=Scleroderma citrinum Foug A TaxID=1036808 RepID=A0A0C3B0G6_9AGAM|nr:hypothetical protein SCLCIDRAFT_1206925 [Scleroderma citrinum Foug A]
MDGVASHGLKDPQTLSFQRPTIRRLILASYWLVILIAVPFWWRLTSIERRALPSNRVHSQLERTPVFPVNVQLDASSFQEKAPIIAKELNSLLTRTVQASPRWKGLEIHVGLIDNADGQTEEGSYTVTLGNATAVRHPRHLTVSHEDALYAARIAELLSGLLAPETSSQDQRVVKYAKRYRLAFSLLNEDVASDRLITSWNVRAAIADHVSPILSRLSMLHDFVIESQIQFHAPLAFEPVRIISENGTLYGVTPADLTVFVNSAEWTLSSSVSEDPVLHFVLFVPSSSRQPLHILDSQGAPTTHATFLLPQWGGIYILNQSGRSSTRSQLGAVDLTHVFAAFANQLSALLGVPSLPSDIASEGSSILSDWQLDAVLRFRASENIVGTQQTLSSIVKLVDQIENMPVDEHVRGDVQDSLKALDQVRSFFFLFNAHLL